ncbi:MAG: ComEC/Rec2 family competence protein [Bdellovibrionales bacterium]|nr:ComEC/Rec2 family competence protein [Bdellovibrionales bacterium]
MLILGFLLIAIESKFKYISPILHDTCLSFSPQSLQKELYQGIVCGKNLESRRLIDLFATTGLLHLLVVSGSHLLALAALAKKLRLRGEFINAICLLYAFLCLLEPPISRAYLFISLDTFQRKHSLQWSPWHQHFMAILLCLTMFPDWLSSLSFQLSILCAFAISLAKKYTDFWIYLTLFPALLILGNYHPLSILINLSLGPLLGLLLFPLSALSFVIPNLYLCVDLIWDLLIKVLTLVSGYLKSDSSNVVKYSPLILWLYIICLWFLGKNNFYANRKSTYSTES